MKVIGGSKTVDLSKKLTVEMTLGEMALMMAVLGETTYGDAEKAINGSDEIGVNNRADVLKLYPNTLYKEMVAVLNDEGVAG